MTLEELNTKREQILKNLGIYQAQYGDCSVQFSDAPKALDIIDNEIAALASTSSNSRTHYGSFSKGSRQGSL